MQGVLRWLLVTVLVGFVVSVPIGCGANTEPNPDLKIPDVPPINRGQKGVLTPDLKAPNKDANEKATPEKK